MRIHYVLALLCAVLFFTQPASAEQRERDCSGAATANGRDNLVVFVNGILNTRPQADCSLQDLRNLVDVEAERSDFRLFYNPTNGFVQDIAELRFQAQISDRATDIAQNDSTILVRGASARYNYVLGKLYSDKIRIGIYENTTEEEVYVRSFSLYTYLRGLVRQDKSITIVAHSQGNFHIEAAIAIMRYRGEDDLVSKIKVVGVASVSSTTPNAVYFSLESDRAIGFHRARSSTLRFFSTLPANAKACVSKLLTNDCQIAAKLSDIEWMTHGFNRVYLNPNILVDGISVRTRIRDQVIRSRGILIGREVPNSPTEEVILQESQNALGTGDCRAFFWVSGVRKPGLDGRHYLILETHSIGTREFLKSYFVWSVDGKETTTWPASYDNHISAGWHTITLEKHVSKNEVYKYTRKINISMSTPTGQEDCSPEPNSM